MNGGQDIFWQARDNALLIKGGANYAYDQINDELSTFLARPAAKGGVSVLHAACCRHVQAAYMYSKVPIPSGT